VLEILPTEAGVAMQQLGAPSIKALTPAMVKMDLHRKSGEFPLSNEELDDPATTVYEGI
jgi:hypothetical protein